MGNINMNWGKEIEGDIFKNPFTKNFIISWLTWNWKVWYITFFVESGNAGNKFLYIIDLYNYYESTWALLSLIIVNWVIAPVLLSTLIVFFITPYISLHFFKKHNENKEQENNSIADVNISVSEKIKSETSIIKAEKDKLEAEFEKERKEMRKQAQEYADKKILEERKKLQNEASIKTADFLNDIHKLDMSYPGWSNELEKLIYSESGYTFEHNSNGKWENGYSNSKYVTIFDTLGLVSSNKPGIYTLTEKGKNYLLHDRLPENEKGLE